MVDVLAPPSHKAKPASNWVGLVNYRLGRWFLRKVLNAAKWAIDRWAVAWVVVPKSEHEERVRVQTWLEQFIKRQYVEGEGEYIYRVKQIRERAHYKGRHIGWRSDDGRYIQEYGFGVERLSSQAVHSDPRELASMFYRMVENLRKQGIDWKESGVLLEMSFAKVIEEPCGNSRR